MEKNEPQKSDIVLEEWTTPDGVFRKVRATRSRVGVSGENVVFDMVQKQIDHSSEGGPTGWQTVHQKEVSSV